MEPRHAVEAWGAWSAPDDREFLQVRSHAHYRNNVEWHLSLRYDELGDRAIHKTKDLSSVTSGRIADHGQRLRVAFLHHLEAHGVDVDIYGRDNSQGFRGYLGVLPPYTKDDGILPYRYTLAAENTAEPNYFTEKIVDAILGETLCFYWGCPNLESYFDPDSFIRLPLDDLDASRRIVADAINSQVWAERLDVIRAQKQRILEEYQVFPTIARVVHGARLRGTLDARVVNLDRRPDRLQGFLAAAARTAGPLAGRIRRHPAVDGSTLGMTDELAHLFRGNDFGFRRSIIGCALTHLAIWHEVAAGPGRPCLVLEDDARFVRGFPGQLVEVCGQLADREPEFDLAFLGYHSWNGPDTHTPGPWHAELEIGAMDWSDFLGGSFGYVVSPEGARRLLACAERDGIRHGIDWFVMRQAAPGLRCVSTEPHLISAPLARLGSEVDSDIQHDFEPLR
jgi:GR25 family glycosyltransferase involved in LPS biosynthesis